VCTVKNLAFNLYANKNLCVSARAIRTDQVYSKHMEINSSQSNSRLTLDA